MNYNSLIQTLIEMNEKFGRGEINAIKILLDAKDGWHYGSVNRDDGDYLWKSDGRFVTFLSRKRKLGGTC